MSGLFLIPVDKDWLDRFNETVTNPVNLETVSTPEILEGIDEARIWGTTDESRKKAFFQKMESGDPVLFYHDGDFFATGRVGEKFEDENLGEELWSEPDSRLIFSISDFTNNGPSLEHVNSSLGYKSTNKVQGFVRPSDEALNNLLQQYNSIEEAFQSFKSGGKTGDEANTPSTESKESPREHTEIQWHLVQLGLRQGYDVYVAKNDQNREYDGNRLANDCVETLNIAGFSDAALRIIEYVDVIWLKDGHIVKMFEVESTTSIFSGILRMTDFVVKVPNLAVDMYIVAGSNDEEKVRREMNRPTFEYALKKSEYSKLNFISFEQVRERRNVVEDAGPLKTVF